MQFGTNRTRMGREMQALAAKRANINTNEREDRRKAQKY